jgi:hypothetical protein
MKNIYDLKHIINVQIPNGKAIIYDFLITFARFECALKNTIRFLHPSEAEPAWDTFAESISLVFNPDSSLKTRNAVDYILNDPPRKQINELGVLIWQNNILNDENSITRKLSVYIRRVRNNLLHGGKFNGSYTPESRNHQLIISSLIILNDWINLDPEIKSNFLADINP